jgi:hypothetical protein
LQPETNSAGSAKSPAGAHHSSAARSFLLFGAKRACMAMKQDSTMTYFIYARDGTSQIVLRRDTEDAAVKKARELKEMGWFEVEVRQDKKPAAA